MLSPRHPSADSFGPPDCELFGSPISTFSIDVHEDQFHDGVSVEQQFCDIICNDYVLESISKQEYAMKVDFSLSVPLPHYP